MFHCLFGLLISLFLSFSLSGMKLTKLFFQAYAFQAPESFNVLQGQFDKQLIKVADPVRNSDYLDSNVCPESNFN